MPPLRFHLCIFISSPSQYSSCIFQHTCDSAVPTRRRTRLVLCKEKAKDPPFNFILNNLLLSAFTSPQPLVPGYSSNTPGLCFSCQLLCRIYLLKNTKKKKKSPCFKKTLPRINRTCTFSTTSVPIEEANLFDAFSMDVVEESSNSHQLCVFTNTILIANSRHCFN